MQMRFAGALPPAIQRSCVLVRLIIIIAPAFLSLNGRCHAIWKPANRKNTELAIDIVYR